MTDAPTTPPAAPAAGAGGPTPPPPPAGTPPAAPAPAPAPASETPPPQNVPPTRSAPTDNKDQIISRLQAKIKSQQTVPPIPTTPPGETPPPPPVQPAGQITEAQVAEIASAAIQEALGGKMQQIDSMAAGQADQQVERFVQQNPVYAQYAETIKAYYKDPSRAQVPLESIAYEVFGAAAHQAMVAQAAGQEVNNNMPAVGVMPAHTGHVQAKDWKTATHAELEAKKNSVLTGR